MNIKHTWWITGLAGLVIGLFFAYGSGDFTYKPVGANLMIALMICLTFFAVAALIGFVVSLIVRGVTNLGLVFAVIYILLAAYPLYEALTCNGEGCFGSEMLFAIASYPGQIAIAIYAKFTNLSIFYTTGQVITSFVVSLAFYTFVGFVLSAAVGKK